MTKITDKNTTEDLTVESTPTDPLEIPKESIEIAAKALNLPEAAVVDFMRTVQDVREPSHTVHASFSGPLPPPSLLQQYDKIQPGFAERIMALTETEAAHVRDMDRKGLWAAIWEARLGQVFGLTIGLAAIFAGTYAAVEGQPLAGGFIGGAGVIGLVTAFIIGRSANDKD